MRSLNLFADDFPDRFPDMRDMDLIICRNVFIYFDHAAVAAVLPKFANVLTIGGYLMTGHAELNAHKLGTLHPKMFPESVLYQRALDEHREGQRRQGKAALPVPIKSPKPPAAKLPAAKLPAAKPPAAKSPTDKPPVMKPEPAQRVVIQAQPKKEEARPEASTALLSEAAALFRSGAYHKVVETLERLTAGQFQNQAALCLAAQACANLGRHDEAIAYCRQAIAVDSLAADPYRLLAHIREEQGDVEEAKRLLKQVIYLAPLFIPAYLELAELYQRGNDGDRARKLRATASAQLQKLPPDAIVDERGGLTARDLIQHLEQPKEAPAAALKSLIS